jgi:hypothetical protein
LTPVNIEEGDCEGKISFSEEVVLTRRAAELAAAVEVPLIRLFTEAWVEDWIAANPLP